MNILFHIIGIILILLSIVTVAMTMASGVGLIFALGVLVLAGFTALTGKIKYALVVLLITTLNISYLALSLSSLLPEITKQSELFPHDLPPVPFAGLTIEDFKEISKGSGIPLKELINTPVEDAEENTGTKRESLLLMLSLVSIPYVFTLLLVGIGYSWKTKRSNLK